VSEEHTDEAEEVILGTNQDGLRTLRVYDSKGDFTIRVPEGAKVTFGYFNPVVHQSPREWGHHPENVARQTALRIYERGEKGNQLACFLGVKGFRDESVQLTRITSRMVVEQSYEDDGDGTVEHHHKRQRTMVALPEPDQYL
jgi:hypothetical protein